MLVVSLLALLLSTPLIDAVRSGDVAAVRALLQDGIDINSESSDGATPLHWATYADREDLVAMLIDAGARVDRANDLGITPLHLASANGNQKVVELLLKKGSKVDAASEAGVTALMEAARAGSVNAVRSLLRAGAAPNLRERSRDQSALMWAAARGHADVIEALLEHGADPHLRSRVRPLTVMLDQGPRRTVKTAKQDARQIDTGGSTALLFAAQNGDAASARRLLSGGANVNDVAADGRSALVLATFVGRGDVAKVLIDAGADLNAAEAGYTALHAAALRGDLATTQALLAKGAQPNAQLTKGSPVRRFGSQWALPTTMTGATPALVAATYLEVATLGALLDNGADPSIGLPDGTTPLLAAAGVAVEKETRPSDLQRWGVIDNDTPVVPRAEADILAAVTRLLDAGASVKHPNQAGDTALHAAAAEGLVGVIELLAARGAELNAKNKNGDTPLSLTMAKKGSGRASAGHPAAEALLRKLGATDR